jgi:pimeloyl-ACP methyl ester carboxylesterase
MRACYFGTPDRRLFGVLDAPAHAHASGRGVVLCYPHGPDYATAFRSYRVLGTRCLRAGFHVMRFDYLGTGDSSGDDEDASLAQWTADVRAAMQELRDSQEVREISLVGLRLGAALATLAAQQSQGADRLVLWEPVADGRRYLAEQLALHRAWLDEERREGRRAPSGDDDLLGSRLTGRLRRELEGLNLLSLSGAPAPRICVLSQRASREHDSLAAFLRVKGARVDALRVAGPEVWSKTPSMEEASVPNAAIQAIVGWLAENSS